MTTGEELIVQALAGELQDGEPSPPAKRAILPVLRRTPRRQAVAVSSGSSSSNSVKLPANSNGITSRHETGDVGSRLLGAAAWVRAQVNPNGSEMSR
jgi:hypothetical protein